MLLKCHHPERIELISGGVFHNLEVLFAFLNDEVLFAFLFAFLNDEVLFAFLNF